MPEHADQVTNAPREILPAGGKPRNRLLGGRHGPALAGYRALGPALSRDPTNYGLNWANAASGELDFSPGQPGLPARVGTRPKTKRLPARHDRPAVSRTSGKLDDARTCFESAVAADPNLVDAPHQSGRVVRKKNGRLDEAWECVEACRAKKSARRSGAPISAHSCCTGRSGMPRPRTGVAGFDQRTVRDIRM